MPIPSRSVAAPVTERLDRFLADQLSFSRTQAGRLVAEDCRVFLPHLHAAEMGVAVTLRRMVDGVPGYPPTLLFFRNSLVGDLVFTLLCVGCLALGRRAARDAAAVPAQAVVRG